MLTSSLQPTSGVKDSRSAEEKESVKASRSAEAGEEGKQEFPRALGGNARIAAEPGDSRGWRRMWIAEAVK